jgi:hypothetical protein
MAKRRDSENDYEVVGTSGGAAPGGIVSVRLKPDEMALLVALSEVSGRSLSETLRLGLRCLADQPSRATGSAMLNLRLDTRASEAVSALPGQPQEPSESSLTHIRVVLV